MMEQRVAELLELPDEILFTHGGCHVFALALREFWPTRIPLVWIHEDGGNHDHLACDPGDNRIVDFFGWFSHQEYIREEHLNGLPIIFDHIEVENVRRRFIFGPGQGYYVHSDFFHAATERACQWIETHLDCFNGTKKVAIPGLCRVRITSKEKIKELFQTENHLS